MSIGAASAPAPNGCCGRDGCRRFREWDIRWCPAMSRSAAWSKRDPTPTCFPASRSSFPARNVLAKSAACSVHPPRASWCRQSASCRSIGISASVESCWRWPRRPITPSRRAARRRRTASSVTACWGGCWPASPSRFATIRPPCGRRTRRAPVAPSITASSIPSTTCGATTRASTTSAATPACSIR